MRLIPRHARVGLTATLSACALAVGLAHSATAAEASSGLTDQERRDLVQWWAEYNVPQDAQDTLLGALDRGELWDAMSGVDPVDVKTRHLATESETVSRYPDGSIVVSTVSAPSDPFAEPLGITPLSVGDCQSSQIGSGYANRYDCKAVSQSGIVTMGFYISYTLVQGGYDQITEVHSGYAHAETGTVTSPTAKIAKAKENSRGSAWAYVRSQYDAFGGSGSAPVEMRALVGNDKAWTRWEDTVS